MSSIIFPEIGAVLAVAAISGAYLLARRSPDGSAQSWSWPFAVPPFASAIEMRRGCERYGARRRDVDGTCWVGGESATIDGTSRAT